MNNTKSKQTKWLKIGLGGAALLLVLVIGFARSNQISPLSWGWYGPVQSDGGLALGGYDVMSYHGGTPVLGKASHSLSWQGVEWRFSSAEHLAQFEQEKQRYAPQFGAFCAFAVSKGFTALSTPTSFHVLDDKLFLFHDDGVKKDWLSGISSGIVQESGKAWAAR